MVRVDSIARGNTQNRRSLLGSESQSAAHHRTNRAIVQKFQTIKISRNSKLAASIQDIVRAERFDIILETAFVHATMHAHFHLLPVKPEPKI